MTQRWNRWTLATVRAANMESGGKFFARETMRFFGDTMKSFRLIHRDGKVFIMRVQPMRDRDGRNMGGVGVMREFNQETGAIGLPINPKANG